MGGVDDGNIDNPQYRWLEGVLNRNSAVHFTAAGRLVHTGHPNRLIVVFAHHTLESLDNSTPDEAAGPCTPATEPGCDVDPRLSTPLHLGLTGKQSLRDLPLRYPNVIAYVAGHTHRNELRPFGRRDRRSGFWQISTASHIDYPQQGREIELMDNRDGTLSLFTTLLDQAGPIATPPSAARASSFTEAQLAAISRRLAANGPQRANEGGPNASGTRLDRNAELVLKDPRRLARRAHHRRGHQPRFTG